MSPRRLALTGTLATVLVAAAASPASAQAPATGRDGTGIQSVTAITEIYPFGQKVSAVAIEYSDIVNPRTLDLATFTVSDSIYNFRFNPLEDLAVFADRTITRIYTNDESMTDADGSSDPGRFVIIELDPADAGGNTVIRSQCFGFLCSEKINPELPTRVIQNEDVYAQAGKGVGRGKVLAAASTTPRPLTEEPINLLFDDFEFDTYVHSGMVVPYAFHLPADYDPERTYPLVVSLPGWGSGFDGQNEGVQIAVDISGVVWFQPEWTASDEDVIVLSPQTQRVGDPAVEAAAMVALLEDFLEDYSVNPDRVYVQTFSWGSTLAWDAMARHPGLFDAALICAGFRPSTEQAAAIAQSPTPVWITHGTSDPVLPFAWGNESATRLRDAYVAAGVEPAEAADLVRFTAFGPEAYAVPDHHAVIGPTYEQQEILSWFLSQ